MKDITDLDTFIKTFDIVDNALNMRTLVRWNGRPVNNKENLAEHTHLVVACAIKMYDFFKNLSNKIEKQLNLENVIRRCMLHDSLELLRGDILSVTKDAIPGLREFCDREESDFMSQFTYTNEITDDFVRLCDLMACYKFMETELESPSSDFITDMYIETKSRYDGCFKEFVYKYNIPIAFPNNIITERLTKGYAEDAGVDVILKEKIVFMPMKTQTVDLDVKFTPKEGNMGILCSRTSAANRGLIVAICPIDANYCGTIKAIVHNVSNQIIQYDAGESFCQILYLPINTVTKGVKIKRSGKRSVGSFGSTNK